MKGCEGSKSVGAVDLQKVDRYRSLETRAKLYDLVRSLRTRGMSYGRIQETVSASLESPISKGSISQWVRGIHKPLGRVNEFNQTAAVELAYVIGVVLSDGNVNSHKYDREVLLSVTDHEYAEEFRRCLGRVVGDLPKLDEAKRGTGGSFRNAASCYTSF